eukprot:scaffold2045_cov404-Prasinococcus_capsulatus_cf.AAC.68
MRAPAATIAAPGLPIASVAQSSGGMRRVIRLRPCAAVARVIDGRPRCHQRVGPAMRRCSAHPVGRGAACGGRTPPNCLRRCTAPPPCAHDGVSDGDGDRQGSGACRVRFCCCCCACVPARLLTALCGRAEPSSRVDKIFRRSTDKRHSIPARSRLSTVRFGSAPGARAPHVARPPGLSSVYSPHEGFCQGSIGVIRPGEDSPPLSPADRPIRARPRRREWEWVFAALAASPSGPPFE